jgi:N-acetylmuramoyl-L-alanine amidase
MTVYKNCEIFRFSGSNRPAYSTSLSGGVLTLTLYNTSGSYTPGVSGSKLVSDVNATTGNNAVSYRFTLKNAGNLLGYGVSFDEDTLSFRLRYKPSAGSGSSPLSGVTVLLDPGHGGKEPGALGVTGELGPNENTINLAHAYATRDALAELGATVMMTREEDTTISLDDRLLAIETTDADIFVSLHHNSIAESMDANTVAGMEIYYHTGLSEDLAKSMLAGLASTVNRSNRGAHAGNYRVTLMNYAPAILAELGYLSNPAEYEKSLDKNEIIKVGKAVADGVLRTLR